MAIRITGNKFRLAQLLKNTTYEPLEIKEKNEELLILTVKLFFHFI